MTVKRVGRRLLIVLAVLAVLTGAAFCAFRNVGRWLVADAAGTSHFSSQRSCTLIGRFSGDHHWPVLGDHWGSQLLQRRSERFPHLAFVVIAGRLPMVWTASLRSDRDRHRVGIIDRDQIGISDHLHRNQQ